MAKRRKKSARAGIITMAALLSVGMGSTTVAYAADVTPGNDSTINYTGPGTSTIREGVSYPTPTASDRTQLRYYGVEAPKADGGVKITAYHIVEGNYNQYGFLGWTQAKAAADAVPFKSFQKTTDNVVQVIVNDNNPDSPFYNKEQVITSDDVANLARMISCNENGIRDNLEKVSLQWNPVANCYETPLTGDNAAEAGMYLVLVEKEDRGVIYNPVIISNDYSDANIARSLSNYVDNGTINSMHSDKITLPDGTTVDFPYESGIAPDNSAFITYGTELPTDKNLLNTGDNRDKAPQDQTDYLSSREAVRYYKDSFMNGNVYSLYSNTDPQENQVETMGLMGTAYAKKSTVSLEKNIRNASVPKTYAADVASASALHYSKYDDVSEGDIVNFDIFTQIPYYSEKYFDSTDNFAFRLTDTQHEGLAAVTADKIKVYAGTSTATDAQSIAADITSNEANLLTAGEGTYTLTIKDDNSFSIDFAKGYCLSNQGAMIIVTYETTVTNDAAKGLNGNPNEVFLEYTTVPSNGTSPEESRAHKFDFAIHYTFSPTAFKVGEDGQLFTDADSMNFVTTEDQKDIAKGQEADKPLAGAKFKLQRVGTHYSENSNATIVDIAPDTTKWTNTPELEADQKTAFNGYQTWFLTSNEDGEIIFDSEADGIDEGIYTLQEIEAPKDYTLNDKIYVIEVNPTFDTATQQFIGTDVKIGMNENGDIANYNILGATFVDGTNYEYDEYGKLLTEYKYSEWVSDQNSTYDGQVANLQPVSNEEGIAPVKRDTVVSYQTNEETGESVKVADTNLLEIINTKLTRLPSTGGIGTIAITAGGFAVMGLATYVLNKSKKNKDE